MAAELAGAAARQRERLRSWLRHERQTVGHSSGPFLPTLKERRTAGQDAHVALRGQGTARTVGEWVAPLVEVAEPQEGQSRSVTWLPRCRRWPCRCWPARQAKPWTAPRGPHHPPVPPQSRHQDAEALGGGGEEEERGAGGGAGGGAGEGAERGEVTGSPPRCTLLFLGSGEEGGEADEEKEEKEEAPEDFFALLFWPLSSTILAAACAALVLLVLYASRVVFSSVVDRPRCSAS